VATRRFESQDPAIDKFYGEIAENDLQPLWELPELPEQPHPRSVPHVWRAETLKRLGDQALELIREDEGADRRVLSCANPGLGGLPGTVGTIAAAMQYLRAGEEALPHRHTPAALRFVLEGSAVWTLVNGDPIHMSTGDLVLTPSWAFHGHHNSGSGPMMWLDVLDVPLVAALDAVFYEPGDGKPLDRTTPEMSTSEHLLGGGPALLPGDATFTVPHSPLMAYRWADTDRALDRQLGHGASHAHVRYSDPTTGGDVMPTMRCEMFRVPSGRTIPAKRQTGSKVACVLHGEARIKVAEETFDVVPGDIVAVPSWSRFEVIAGADDVDLFTTSDAPVHIALRLYREQLDD
jgi:gentisate 1,2-dioxygenase